MSVFISTFDRLGEFVVEFRGTAGRVVHEKVVRCQDCEYALARSCAKHGADIEPDGFCWLGRRADEKAE